MKITKNIGVIDRILRVILGVLIIYYGLMIDSWIVVVGALVIFSAAIGMCPLYRVLKVSTCSKKSTQD